MHVKGDPNQYVTESDVFDVPEFLQRLEAAGIRLTLRGHRLSVSSARPLRIDAKALIVRYSADIVDLLIEREAEHAARAAELEARAPEPDDAEAGTQEVARSREALRNREAREHEAREVEGGTRDAEHDAPASAVVAAHHESETREGWTANARASEEASPASDLDSNYGFGARAADPEPQKLTYFVHPREYDSLGLFYADAVPEWYVDASGKRQRVFKHVVTHVLGDDVAQQILDGRISRQEAREMVRRGQRQFAQMAKKDGMWW